MFEERKKWGPGWIESVQENSKEENYDPPEYLQEVLQKFKTVFAKPQGLPPCREQDHAIVLKEGIDPMSVRPIPLSTCLEKWDWEHGLHYAWSSDHPTFHRPFLKYLSLGQKERWVRRFCVDYWALNKVTMVDKYTTPIIDELLDDLYGDKKFLKVR